jgi:hypothetical protein
VRVSALHLDCAPGESRRFRRWSEEDRRNRLYNVESSGDS